MTAEAALGHKVRQPKIAPEVPLQSSRTYLVVLSIIFLMSGAWILVTTQTGLGGEGALIGLLAGVLVLLFTFIFFVTPAMMAHFLAPGKLVIRHGILFRADVPIADIEEAEMLDVLPGGGSLLFGVPLGVQYSMIDRRFTALKSKNGLLRIRMAKEIRIRNWLIPRRVIEIIFDTLDGETVLDAVQRHGQEGKI